MQKTGYTVKDACEALGVSRSRFYRGDGHGQSPQTRARKDDEQETLQLIFDIKAAHPFWGYRRVWAWLRFREKRAINHKRVYRIMKENKLLVNIKQYKAKKVMVFII